MNTILPDALENCLQRMEQGESLDSVLAHYPDLAAELRPLLETAVQARSARRENLPVGVLLRQRSRGLALAAELHQKNQRLGVPRRFWRPALTVFAVIIILIFSANSIYQASAHSIPGDTLYPLKRSVESTQLRLVSNPAKKLELEHIFSQRRLDETKSLISEDRVESVEFTGVVSSQSDGEWLVSGIKVMITSQTKIDKGVQIGDVVEVSGSTDSSGSVVANHLSLAEGDDSDSILPEGNPTQPSASEDEHPEDSSIQTPLPEVDHPEVSPTQPASPEYDHPEASPTQPASSEDDHPESTPTQISYPENDHSENSPTLTPSPEGNHPESSPTQSPTLDGSN